ncbi:MAG: membrane protein insertase YidC, partial [Caldimonas sp.]
MTDIRRTILWVVFSMSLFLIWDAWNKHNGQPSFFSPPHAAAPAAAGAAPGAASNVATPAVPGAGAVPVPTIANPAQGAAAVVPAASAPIAAVPTASVTITTDVVKATLDSTGGSLDRVELLKELDPHDHTKHVVLLDQSAHRLSVAQTGLVPPAGGAGLPNHHTPMTIVPGERTLQPGQNELQVKFESAAVGGVKLVKTYTFRRGDYVIDVKHEVVNDSAAPVNPRLYLQLVRDGNAPAGESSFYFTFTGPAIYTEGAKFKKIPFKEIEKHKP